MFDMDEIVAVYEDCMADHRAFDASLLTVNSDYRIRPSPVVRSVKCRLSQSSVTASSTIAISSLGKEFSITPYLLISSQYDVFRRGRYTQERYQLLTDAALEKLRNTCTETSVLYSYPGRFEWLVD